MKCANLNFRYFIHVICCSFIIYMGYIKSLKQQMLFISQGFLPSLNFVCSSANSGYKGMFDQSSRYSPNSRCHWLSSIFAGHDFYAEVQVSLRGTQRECSSKPLKHSIQHRFIHRDLSFLTLFLFTFSICDGHSKFSFKSIKASNSLTPGGMFSANNHDRRATR